MGASGPLYSFGALESYSWDVHRQIVTTSISGSLLNSFLWLTKMLTIRKGYISLEPFANSVSSFLFHEQNVLTGLPIYVCDWCLIDLYSPVREAFMKEDVVLVKSEKILEFGYQINVRGKNQMNSDACMRRCSLTIKLFLLYSLNKEERLCILVRWRCWMYGWGPAGPS